MRYRDWCYLGSGSTDLNQRKEQFSKAYVQAVASVAGFSATTPAVDDDSIDLFVSGRGREGTVASPRLELQAKGRGTDSGIGEHFSYDLKLKNYEDLRLTNFLVPRILVVVLVPASVEYWLEQSEKRLSMKHCGYWVSLRGMEKKDNKNTVAVHVPRANLFTVETLASIMQGISNGVWP